MASTYMPAETQVAILYANDVANVSSLKETLICVKNEGRRCVVSFIRRFYILKPVFAVASSSRVLCSRWISSCYSARSEKLIEITHLPFYILYLFSLLVS